MTADVDLTRTWLMRSSHSPLSIRLGGSPISFFHFHPTHPAIELLTQHAERWQHVHFRISPAMWNQIQPAKNRLARLRSVVIDSEPGSRDFFQVAPQLRSLKIGQHMSADIYVPWTQLTSVNVLADLSIDQCYEILQQAPNLIDCHFRVCYDGLHTFRIMPKVDAIETQHPYISCNPNPSSGQIYRIHNFFPPLVGHEQLRVHL